MDTKTLDTLQQMEYTDGIPGDLSLAHPKVIHMPARATTWDALI